MSIKKWGIGATGTLMFAIVSVPGLAAEASASGAAPPSTATSEPVSSDDSDADDVPAPPMLLLFGLGAVGLIWGRRLAANARKKHDKTKPD